jgi:hypothetical protein
MCRCSPFVYRLPTVTDMFPIVISRSRYLVISNLYSRPAVPVPFPFPAKIGARAVWVFSRPFPTTFIPRENYWPLPSSLPRPPPRHRAAPAWGPLSRRTAAATPQRVRVGVWDGAGWRLPSPTPVTTSVGGETGDGAGRPHS